MGTLKKVSVIIPTYNEEKAIGKEIDKIIKAMDESLYEYEIIVVDDGSQDKTTEVVKNKEVKLIQHLDNKGYGAAIKTGIRNARYRFIAITDADGSYPVEKIPELIEYLGEYDMVVGARIGRSVKMPLFRKPAKWIINHLANYLAGVRIPDLNSGLRVIKKDIVEKFFNLLPSGFSFTTTITLAMFTNDYTIKYLPIDYFKRIGRSKIRPVRDTVNLIQLVIRTVMYFNPLKIFVPLSLLLLLLSIFVLLYSYFFTPKVMDITTIVLFVAAIQMFGLGMVADLINKRMR